jgi:hypothetical protein
MNKIYTGALLLLLFNFGCDCFHTCNGPEIETLLYFRYVNDDLPPLEEIYDVTEQGPLLVNVLYDSDGDWIADKALYFSQNPEDSTPKVKDIKGKITRKYVTKANIREYFTYTPENRIMETLIEPIDADKINRRRFESPEYKKAVESILRMSPNFKANDISAKDIEKKEENSRTLEILLFPINLPPDIVSNTVLTLFNPFCSMAKGEGVSNLWLPISVFSPILGIVGGIMDAWHGYPFWNPIALDEHRKY